MSYIGIYWCKAHSAQQHTTETTFSGVHDEWMAMAWNKTRTLVVSCLVICCAHAVGCFGWFGMCVCVCIVCSTWARVCVIVKSKCTCVAQEKKCPTVMRCLCCAHVVQGVGRFGGGGTAGGWKYKCYVKEKHSICVQRVCVCLCAQVCLRYMLARFCVLVPTFTTHLKSNRRAAVAVAAPSPPKRATCVSCGRHVLRNIDMYKQDSTTPPRAFTVNKFVQHAIRTPTSTHK